ncbi:MAG: hypothetical protein LBV43_06405 [Prevotella sp.]|jgi:hypothetical protein|nr:hypothetical protein [Prevotella sp.]
MKGFEIHYNENVTKVAVEDGVAFLNIFHNDNKSWIYADGVDYTECRHNIWCNYIPIEIGNKIMIRITEIDCITTPIRTFEDKSVKRPKTKMEIYRELEENLKNEGLL